MLGFPSRHFYDISMTVRQASLILCTIFLAACASEPPPTAPGPARYASADEAARLHAQAAVNFQRERERQGMAAVQPSQPRVDRKPVAMQASAASPVYEGPREKARPTRQAISAAEARYAAIIGKDPRNLSPYERAVALGNR